MNIKHTIPYNLGIIYSKKNILSQKSVYYLSSKSYNFIYKNLKKYSNAKNYYALIN